MVVPLAVPCDLDPAVGEEYLNGGGSGFRVRPAACGGREGKALDGRGRLLGQCLRLIEAAAVVERGAGRWCFAGKGQSVGA